MNESQDKNNSNKCHTEEDDDDDIFNLRNTKNVSSWVLNITFDRLLMHRKNMTMLKVYQAVWELLQVTYGSMGNFAISYSDDASGDGTNHLEPQVVMRLAFNLSNDNVDENNFSNNKKTTPPLADNDIIMLLQKIEQTLINKISIGGISGITETHVRERTIQPVIVMNKGGSVKKEIVIDTDGKNLLEVLGLPSVDDTKTTSNDICEVLDVLGIEAARSSIISEMNEVITSARSYVNMKHINLLADTMTRSGFIVSIDRHGINKNKDISILSRASFEKTPETLIEAAVFGIRDNMKGVSGCVMFGQPVKIGTGSVKLHAMEGNVDQITKYDSISELNTFGKSEVYETGSWAIQFSI